MERIALTTQFTTRVDLDEVRKVLDDALRRETELADTRCAHFERLCRVFEQQHQMSSTEFIQRFESGELGDDIEYFDWYAAKRGLDLWGRRLHILSGVKV